MAKKRWVIKICKARRIPNTQQLPTAAQRREREREPERRALRRRRHNISIRNRSRRGGMIIWPLWWGLEEGRVGEGKGNFVERVVDGKGLI
jgi:hypothetical protein